MTRCSGQILRKLVLLGLCLLLPLSALAQDLVAVILPGDLPRYAEAHKAFDQVIAAGGKGQVKVITKRPHPDQMSQANDIRRLVGAGAKILVTYGATATLVAKQEARGVPVIFADVCDPVSLGIVKTLEAPGTDMTGASCFTPMRDLVESLVAISPVKKVGVIYSADDPASELQSKGLENLGKTFGFSVLKEQASKPTQVDGAFANLSKGIDALYLADCAPTMLRAGDLIGKATAAKIPVFSQIPGVADEGALVTLEADPTEQGKLIAVHVLQILAGQKAHVLPVRTAKKINLVVNAQAATKLGLAIPASVKSSAGRIID